MESSGFFDYQEVNGVYDREYAAEQFANYFKLFVGNGIFGNPTDQLLVSEVSGMQIKMSMGWAFINGYWYYNSEDKYFTVRPNQTASIRNDAIFVVLNDSTREITTELVSGRTKVERGTGRYELRLCSISVPVASTSIKNSNITDNRLDESVCGIVTGLLQVQTTNALFQQFTSQFNTWFDSMKGQLTTDAAGNLQNQIGSLPELTTTIKTSITAAINWLHTQVTNAVTLVSNIKTWMMAAIAPNYSPSQTYKAGAYVIYNNILYRCKTAITVIEAWNATHWTQVTLGKEIETVNNSLGGVQFRIVDGKLQYRYIV